MAPKTLQVNMFGGFSVVDREGVPVQFGTAKAKALFAYLVMTHPRMQSRDLLGDLLWTDAPRDAARTNLRQTLARIRRALASVGDPILTDGDGVGIALVHLDADVAAFREKAAAPDVWASALPLYAGEFMAGFHVAAPAFDDWLLVERQRLADMARALARRVIADHRQNGRLDAAIGIANLLLGFDNLQEDVHRTLIELLAESGRRDAALNQYRLLERTLRRELDAEPDPRSRALFARLAGRQGPDSAPAPAPAHRSDGVARRAVGALGAAAERARGRSAHGEAATLYGEAIALVRDLDRLEPAAELDLRAGFERSLYASDRLEECMAELAEIVRLANEVGDLRRRVGALSAQAQVARALGRPDSGTAAARGALAGARQLGDRRLEALANLRLASLHFRTGQYRRALPLLMANAARLAPSPDGDDDGGEMGDPVVRNQSWLAWTCAELGRAEQAQRFGLSGVERSDETGEHYGRAHARMALGIARLRGGDHAAALGPLSEGLELARRAELPIFVAFIEPALALAAVRCGRSAEARRLLRAALLSTNRPIAMCFAAEAWLHLGEREHAVDLASRARHAAAVADLRGDEGWASYCHGAAILAAGKAGEALMLLEDAAAIAARLGMRPLGERSAAALAPCRDGGASLSMSRFETPRPAAGARAATGRRRRRAR